MSTQPVSEMTAAEVQIELMRLQGTYIQVCESSYVVVIKGESEREYKKLAWAKKHLLATAPYYPHDAGAALALCQEIGNEHKWAVVTYSHHRTAYGAAFVIFDGDGTWREVLDGDTKLKANFQKTPALALSRLALLALREMDA